MNDAHLEDLRRRRRALAKVFCERPREMAALRQQFESLRARGGPHAAVVLGEPGRGKTRLLQEFFARLSTTDDLPEDKGGYWPDALPRLASETSAVPDRLEVAAPIDLCRPSNPMPYLWWGFRLEEQSSGRTKLAAVKDDLSWHFEEAQLRQRRHDRARAGLLALGWLTWRATKFILSLIGIHIPDPIDITDNFHDLTEAARDLYGIGREHARDVRVTGSEYQKAAQRTIVDAYLALFEAFYKPSRGKDATARLPSVIVLDDAHNLRRDPSALDFVRRLAEAAQEQDWPILFLATHWEQEWNAAAAEPDSFRSAMEQWVAKVEIVRMPPHPDLGLMVPAVLPGIGAAATRALLAKAGGSPRYLEEMLLLAAQRPQLFLGETPDGPFHETGLARLLQQAQSYRSTVRGRLDLVGPAVGDTLSASSLQGERFLTALTLEVLTALRLDHDHHAAIRQAEDPYALVVRLGDQAADFSESIYRDVAAEKLLDRPGDVAEVANQALRAGVTRRMEDEDALAALPAEQQGILFTVAVALFDGSADSAEQRVAGRALARSAGLALAYYDYAGLRLIVERLEELWRAGRLDFAALPYWELFSVQDAFNIWGRFDAARAAAAAMAADRTGEESIETRRQRAVGLSQLAIQEMTAGLARKADEKHGESLMLFRALAKELGTPSSRRDVSVSLNKVADTKAVLGAPAEALPLYEESLGLFRALAKELGTPSSRRDVSVSLNKVAETKAVLGAPAEALPLYEESLALRRALAKELGTPSSRRDVSVSLNKVAETKAVLGAPAEALPLYEESLALSRALAKELGTPESRRDVSVSLNKVAETKAVLGAPAEALPLYEESLALSRALAKELGTPESRRDVSVSLNKVAETKAVLGAPAEALPLYEESLALSRALAKELGTPESRRDVSVSLNKVAETKAVLGAPAAALPLYEESLALRRALAKELGTPSSRRDVSVSLEKVADTKAVLGAPAEALPLYEESLGLRRALAKELGTPESRRDVSVSLIKVADTKAVLGAPAEALPLYEESLGLFRALAKELGTPSSRRDVSVSLNKVADTKAVLGAPAEALPLYEESLALSRALAKELGTPSSRRDVSVSLEKVADTKAVLGAPAEALPLYEESLALRRALAKELGTPSSRRDVSVSLNKVADTKAVLGAPAEALPLYEESLALRRALAKELGTPSSRRDVSVSLNKIADTKAVLGAPAEALPLYEESLALRRAVAKELGTPESFRDVAISCGRLGDYSQNRLGDADGARKHFLEALEIWRRLDADLDIPDTKRGPAVILLRLVALAETQAEQAQSRSFAVEGLAFARAYVAIAGEVGGAPDLVAWFEAAVARLS